MMAQLMVQTVMEVMASTVGVKSYRPAYRVALDFYIQKPLSSTGAFYWILRFFVHVTSLYFKTLVLLTKTHELGKWLTVLKTLPAPS